MNRDTQYTSRVTSAWGGYFTPRSPVDQRSHYIDVSSVWSTKFHFLNKTCLQFKESEPRYNRADELTGLLMSLVCVSSLIIISHSHARINT